MSFLGFLTSYYLLIIIFAIVLTFILTTTWLIKLNRRLREESKKEAKVSPIPSVLQKDTLQKDLIYHHYVHVDGGITLHMDGKESLLEPVKEEDVKVENVKDNVTPWEKNIVKALEKKGYRVSKDDIQK